jgi:peptide deformylase
VIANAPVRTLASLLLLSAGCATAPAAKKGTVELPIVQTGHPVLRERAKEVTPEQIQTPEFQALVQLMVKTMRAAPGVGLAAPQVGESLRVFVIEDPPALMSTLTEQEKLERERVPVPLKVFINPVVTPQSEEKATFFEGCLSVSGFAALVPRHFDVEVSALDEHGQPFTWRARGWPARILQHELDHLDGTLYVDRMHTRSYGTLPQVKQRFSGKPIAEVLKTFGL